MNHPGGHDNRRDRAIRPDPPAAGKAGAGRRNHATGGWPPSAPSAFQILVTRVAKSKASLFADDAISTVAEKY